MVHCEDEQGACGVLILTPAFGHKVRVESYDDRDQFKFKYNSLLKAEDEQRGRAVLSRAKHAL